ncbi:PLP-dependent aminotransferase family protein [Brevibacillus sp. SYP-B805]|uniref:MocR-like pyridoxine biosynthesis transcription factor PdxR n=1 Tax=Brevibacillus sp. SYP-B805 TaxID=1578199 RepID=UPI0013EBDE6F|nr:PLP-dependent aminotransferase family protein [Brevibacillus sp. SYP-B805]NGQ97012.1 PLP-dependent aminotransferase family protein [Brevibacillus sp. SYP-B805]
MLDILPRLHGESAVPLYMQLYHHFREEIQANRIAAGTKLPSVRRLSAHLQISKTTVEMAYHQLLAEGYVESRDRSGFYVVEIEGGLSGDQAVPPAAAVSRLPGAEKPVSYDFHMARIDAEHFPFAVWRRLSNQCIRPEAKELLHYGDRQGEYGLRTQIAHYLRQSRGVRCTPEQVVIAAGTQIAILLICQLLGMDGRAVAMEEPGYQDVRAVFAKLGFTMKPIPLEEDGLNIQALRESGARVVYITPSHQDPSGTVMPVAKRMKLLQWADEVGGVILEDDYDSEFRYRGKPIPSLQGLDARGSVIYLGTFSKALLPAIRVSYLVLPQALLERYREQCCHFDQTVSRLHQKTLELFMQSGEWERHIRKMRVIYQKKHAALLQAVKAIFQDNVRVMGQDAGLSVMLEVQSEKSAEELEKIAEEAGIKVYSTTRKWMNRPQGLVPSFQLGFGGLSVEEIWRGIERLHACWKPYLRENRRE